MEWVDDAFYGYICTAKDKGGQLVAILTSSVGAALISENRKQQASVNGGTINGATAIDNKYTATVGFGTNGLNAFLYQLTLAPLYFLIATQKIFVCNTNSIMAIIPPEGTGFSISLGRSDLQAASNLVGGTCMTSFYEAQVDDALTNSANSAISASVVNEIIANAGSTAADSGNQASQFSTQADSITSKTASSTPAAKVVASTTADPAQSKLSTFSKIKSKVGKFTKFLGRFQSKIPIHYIDAFIAYSMGVVSGLQDVAQVLDYAHCKLPDYYIYRATSCACLDEAVTIPEPRALQGVSEGAHWCTGTLKMMDSFGNPIYIYNELSYSQLRSSLGTRMDAYLRCISRTNQNVTSLSQTAGDCKNLEPVVLNLKKQQVSAIAVFQRCKANFQQKQWDEGAFLFYADTATKTKYLNSVVLPKPSPQMQAAVGNCLVTAQADGGSSSDNRGCMQDFIKMSQVTHWRYERHVKSIRAPTSASDTDPLIDTRGIDACIVFSGPAANEDPNIHTEFRKCSNSFPDAGCKIPSMIWSSGSKNRVPVANLHMVDDSTVAGRTALAHTLFQEANTMAMHALKELEDFVDKNLNVVLFSGEGDSLHQVFDCIMQGPYARHDLWPKGSHGSLSVPHWARDEGGLGVSRTMDLPCIGYKLKGDYEPPFTCGGDTRYDFNNIKEESQPIYTYYEP